MDEQRYDETFFDTIPQLQHLKRKIPDSTKVEQTRTVIGYTENTKVATVDLDCRGQSDTD